MSRSRSRAAVLLTAATVVAGVGLAAASSASIPPQAVKVSVKAGRTTPHVDASLTQGSAIFGQAQDSGGNGVASATVYVFTPNGQSMGSSSTDGAGNYRVASLPPSATGYIVCIQAAYANSSTTPVQYGYVGQCNGSSSTWYSGDPFPKDARRVKTTVGDETEANFVLSDAGAITGTVSARSSGDPLPGSYIQVYSGSGRLVSSNYSNDGTYTVPGLAPSTFRVCFEPPYNPSNKARGYVAQCYRNKPWSQNGKPAPKSAAIAVSPGTATEADQSLPPAGAIDGTVRSAAKPSHPFSGAVVQVYSGGKPFQYGYPQRNGTYHIAGLPSGTFKVCSFALRRVLQASTVTATPRAAVDGTATAARPSLESALQRIARRTKGSPGQCWKDVAWNGKGGLPGKARAVHVKQGTTTGGIDFRLGTPPRPKSGIAGKVTGPTGHGVRGADVIAFRPQGGFVNEVTTNKKGMYRLAVPPSGKTGYIVCAEAPFNEALRAQQAAASKPLGSRCWKDVPWTGRSKPASKALVTTSKGHTHKGITIKLPAAGAISGTVDFGGTVVPNVGVTVSTPNGNYVGSDYTDDQGRYSIPGISPSDHAYVVCFTPGFADISVLSPDYGFRPQCYRNQPWDGTT